MNTHAHTFTNSIDPICVSMSIHFVCKPSLNDCIAIVYWCKFIINMWVLGRQTLANTSMHTRWEQRKNIARKFECIAQFDFHQNLSLPFSILLNRFAPNKPHLKEICYGQAQLILIVIEKKLRKKTLNRRRRDTARGKCCSASGSRSINEPVSYKVSIDQLTSSLSIHTSLNQFEYWLCCVVCLCATNHIKVTNRTFCDRIYGVTF